MSSENLTISRTKNVKKNIVGIVIVRCISMLISLLYVPLLYKGMNANNYGIWLTLTSLISWVAMFDIGLGNGLRNKLTEALAKNDFVLGKTLVSTAYVCIFAFVFLILFCFAIAFEYIPWDRVLNASGVDITELNILVAVVFITFAIHFSLNLLNSVLYSLQMPALSAFITMIGQLFAFLATFVAVKMFNITSLMSLGIIVSSLPLITLILSSIYIYSCKYKDIAPSIKCFDRLQIKGILSLGLKFFIIQISTIILFQANNLFITHIVDNVAVVEYNIAYKYMHILVIVFTVITTPIWSATTDAYSRGDLQWIKDACKKMRMFAGLLSFGGLVMLIASKYVYNIWLGGDTNPVNFSTTLLLYLHSMAMIFYGCYGYIINGIGKLKVQIIMSILLSVIYIPVAIILGKYYGLVGILGAFCLITFANYIWAKIQYTKLVNQTAIGIWSQ